MRRVAIVGTIAVVLLLVSGVVLRTHTTDESYRSALAESVEKARGAVLTAAEVADASAHHKTTAAYRAVMIDDALEQASTALNKVTTADIPSPNVLPLRDATVPLLARSTSLIHDVTVVDGDELTRTAGELRALGNDLDRLT